MVTARPTESPDYREQIKDEGDVTAPYPNETMSKARIVIIATAILGGLLIIVVVAILCKYNMFLLLERQARIHWLFFFTSDLVLNSKKRKENRTPKISIISSSDRSVLTFSNPNYNIPDGNMSSAEPKATIWKRFKYDKSNVRLCISIVIHILVTNFNFLVKRQESGCDERCMTSASAIRTDRIPSTSSSVLQHSTTRIN